MGCDQFEPYGFASCRLHNWSTRVVGSGERAQAPKSGTGPYAGPLALAYGPEPKQPVSASGKHKIIRYFIVFPFGESPNVPRSRRRYMRGGLYGCVRCGFFLDTREAVPAKPT